MDGTQRGRLVVGRQPGQSVVLTMPDGTQVYVTLYKSDNDNLRLVFDAPRDVHIMRAELTAGGVR